MNELGEFLRDKREKAELTQKKVADKIGVSCNTIQNWEKGSIPKDENRHKISQIYGVSEDEIIKVIYKSRKKERNKIDNWPSFLFDENTNKIVRKIHLGFELQELFGQLYMAGAITLEKKFSDYEEIDLKKLLPGDIEKHGGSIRVLKLAEDLKFVLRYVQESFLKEQLIKRPNEEFDLCSLDKEAICNYIDRGYKTFWDESEADNLRDVLDININMHKTIQLLLEMEKGDIYWTDDNVNNSRYGGPKEIWKYNNKPREELPEVFKDCECIRTIPLRGDFYKWYEKDSDDGSYKKCYIQITDIGKQLLQWWRGK